MKDNPGKKPPGSGRHVGFYVALYSAAGIMLALAAVIGWRSFSPASPGLTAMNTPPPEMVAVNRDTAPSYLTPADRAAAAPSIAPRATAAPATKATAPPATAKPATQANPTATAAPKAQQTQATDVPKTAEPPASALEWDGESAIIDPSPEEAAALDYLDYEAWMKRQASQAVSAEPPSFTAFEGGRDMAWPLTGDIVMAYSVDHVVYDKTLDQYRVNDNICIAAENGTVVSAAAPGVVSKVTTTREGGKTVVIDNGNGWLTTYSQLDDPLLIQPGDVVTTGQPLGSVGKPSIYSILLGDHLGFAVTKDGSPMNPADVLVARAQ